MLLYAYFTPKSTLNANLTTTNRFFTNDEWQCGRFKISNRTINTNGISNRTYDSKSNRITKLRRSLNYGQWCQLCWWWLQSNRLFGHGFKPVHPGPVVKENHKITSDRDTLNLISLLWFLAHNSIYMLSMIYAIASPAGLLSVRPSVRHMGGSVKTLEVRIMITCTTVPYRSQPLSS